MTKSKVVFPELPNVTFPELDIPVNKQSWDLYLDKSCDAEKMEAKAIFKSVKTLIESPDDQKETKARRLQLWSNLVKTNSRFSWDKFGLNRYLFRLAFLLSEHKPKKRKNSMGVLEIENKNDVTFQKYLQDFANYIQEIDHPKSRYVREQMAYYLFSQSNEKDEKSKFSRGLEDKPPAYYFGSSHEEKEIRALLGSEENEHMYHLYLKFDAQSRKYAEKFLKTGERRFLEQMEICSLAMQFVTKDYPQGEKIKDFMHSLQLRFKNKDEVWYKGKISGFFGNKNNLHTLIETLSKEFGGKVHPHPTLPTYASGDEPGWLELMSMKKLDPTEPFPIVDSVLFRDNQKFEKEPEKGTELTSAPSKRKNS